MRISVNVASPSVKVNISPERVTGRKQAAVELVAAELVAAELVAVRQLVGVMAAIAAELVNQLGH